MQNFCTALIYDNFSRNAAALYIRENHTYFVQNFTKSFSHFWKISIINGHAAGGIRVTMKHLYVVCTCSFTFSANLQLFPP